MIADGLRIVISYVNTTPASSQSLLLFLFAGTPNPRLSIVGNVPSA
jgi:hypothetical protein